MAEMAPTLDTYVEESSTPRLELIVGESERFPKLSPDEAEYLIEKGPVVARLRAKQRILEIAMKLVQGFEETDMFPSGYLESLKADVHTAAAEVKAFVHNKDKSESMPVVSDFNEPKLLQPKKRFETAVKMPELFLLDTDEDRTKEFLKRKATALCAQVDPELFFPEKGGSTKPAKKICEQSCDMTAECLRYALESGERFGIWGGKSERERRKLNREASNA